MTDPHYALTLVKGTMADDKPFWAYVAIPLDRLNEFRAAERSGDYNLNQFGDILKFGYETAPSEAVIAEMKTLYNFDDSLDSVIVGYKPKSS